MEDYKVSDFRYELKMECEQTLMPQVQSWVKLHPAGFREAFPPRRVNSVYLDTYALDTLNDHIEGVPVRRKFRFRWYGEDLGYARGQFEIKNKNERVGWKITQPVPLLFNLRSTSWAEIQHQMTACLQMMRSNLFLELLRVSRPLVMISYLRKYYISGDGLIRLTLDSHQKAFDQWMTVYPNISFHQPDPDLLVVEFKSDISNSRDMADILAEFPLRTRRHSKFVSAVSSILER